eukprot:CAMPEP_0170175266 /NCGR_PEP_ID=MMETSP0040_2-20121228/8364_1 /TAXON_ID=641309 /ORGANISM="Lotharella oceanica, Strain CCMP622" /LENGTH=322 /DNA_ID=CAMNT_0010417185 /DNA_START=275 /DNA_END=1243 /DNA_ORIENTATION=+
MVRNTRKLSISESRQRLIFAAVSLGYPALCILLCSIFVPEAMTEKANDSAWCFIPYRFWLLRLFVVYIPLLLAWILTALFYCRARRVLGQIEKLTVAQRSTAIVTGGATENAEGGGSSTKKNHNRDRSESKIWISGAAVEDPDLQETSIDTTKEKDIQSMRAYQRRLLLIPLLFVVARFPGFVYRMAEMVWYVHLGETDHLPSSWDWLSIALAFGDPAQGIINASIFVFGYKEVRIAWANVFGLSAEPPQLERHGSYSPSAVSEALLNPDEATVVIYAADDSKSPPMHVIPGFTSSDSMEALAGKMGAIETTRPQLGAEPAA